MWGTICAVASQTRDSLAGALGQAVMDTSSTGLASDSVSVAVTIVTALLSGLASAMVAVVIYGRREKRRFKVDTLKHFAANRYDLLGDEFSRALNEIFVVFNDSRDVMKVLAEFHANVVTGQHQNPKDDTIIRLYKAMCRDTKIRFDDVTDSFFLTPFNTRKTAQPPTVPTRSESSLR